MLSKKIILKNAGMSVLQVLVMGLALAVLYRYLLDHLGSELLGVWSLVLATASLSQISNLGLIDSVVKFVSKFHSHGEQEKISSLIQTICLTVAICLGGALVGVFFLAENLLVIFLEPALLKEALWVLPFNLLSAWFMAIASIYLAVLDGYHRVDLRNVIMIVNYVLYVTLSILLVKSHGLRGLAVAQFSINLILLVMAYLRIQHLLKVPIIPRVWDRLILKEIFKYSLGFQVVTVSKIVCDPLTKYLISWFGGLVLVAYFEMASKMIQQFRGLVVAANHALIPAISELNEKQPQLIHKIYIMSYQWMLFITIPLATLIGGMSPLISKVWIGAYNESFIYCTLILLIGWFLNLLSVPAYYVYVGIGRMKWNVISHGCIALLTLVFGVLFGKAGGGLGVIFGFSLALVLGGAVTMFSLHLEENIRFRVLLPDMKHPLKWMLKGGDLLSD